MMKQVTSYTTKKISPATNRGPNRKNHYTKNCLYLGNDTTNPKEKTTTKLKKTLDDELDLKVPPDNPEIGFKNKEDGLYCYKLTNGMKHPKDSGKIVAHSPITVLFNVIGVDGTGGGKVIGFNNRFGKWEEVEIPDEKLETPAEIRRLLRRHLLIIPQKSRFTTDHLIDYLIYRDSNKIKTLVRQTGWVEQKGFPLSTFVLPTGIVGRDSQKYFFNSPEDESARSYIFESGSLKGWQEYISKPFGGASKRAIFAICAELASPLMGLLGGDAGLMVNFFERSTKGKTTFLRVAQSCIGSSKKDDFISWRSANVGLEQVINAHRDLTVCIDELGSSRDKNQLTSQVYSIGNGNKTFRSNSDLTLNMPKSNRGIVLVTSEEAMGEIQDNNGHGKPKGGIAVRCLDIPFNSKAKDLGVFEMCPIVPTETGYKTIELNRLTGGIDLENYLQDNIHFGHAVPAFVKCLISIINDNNLTNNGVKYLKNIINDELIKSFVVYVIEGAEKKFSKKVQSQQILRVVGNVARLYAAGMLASGYKNLINAERLKSLGYDNVENITGWDQSQVLESCKDCFYDWLEEYGTTQDKEVDNAIQKIKAEIETNLLNYISADSNPTTGYAYGKEIFGWRKDERERTHIYLPTKTFNKITRNHGIKRKLFELGILVNENHYKGTEYTDRPNLPLGNGKRGAPNVYHVIYEKLL